MAELLSPERIKKELTDDDSAQHSAQPSASASKSSSISGLVTSPGCGSGGSNRVMTVSSGGRSVIPGRLGTSTTCGGQKTILLVQAVGSKNSSSPSAGGTAIQSLLLPASMRPAATITTSDPILSHRHNNNSVSKLADSASVTPARLGVRVVSVPSAGHQNPAPAGLGASPGGQSHVDGQTPYGLVFNSRTIQADGTVCTSKEYLCNFCTYKVSTAGALLEHSSTHLFACNHCSFRSATRLDSLVHKRDSHPSALDELAGFEDLDRPSLVAKTARLPRIVGTAAFLPVGSSANSRIGPATSLGVCPPRSAPAVSRPVCSTSVAASAQTDVVRTMSRKTGDSYFTYRIAHDADGRVQAYECDVCGFRSGQINEMFSHAATHSLADLAKSGSTTSTDVVWECFYCPFSAPLQASVVSHVIASHPNQPIQLKRLPTPATADKTSSAVKAALSKPSDMPCLSPELPLLDKLSQTGDGGKSAKPPATAKSDKKKKSDAGDEGCIWGCYYCQTQSASRNDIISHLKKQHANEKLVVTRRRITHVPPGGANSMKPQGPTSDGAPETAGGPEIDPAAETQTDVDGEEASKADDRGKSAIGKSRKRHTSAVADGDLQQTENNDVGDGSGSSGGTGSSKSRRKQIAPRKVADDPPPSKTLSEQDVAQTAVAAVNGLADVPNSPGLTLETRSATPGAGVGQSLLAATTAGPRKHGRGSLSKYENLIKKLKMAENEDNGLDVSRIADKSRPEESPRNSPAAERPSRGKALSLLTGQLVSGYVRPPNGIPTLPSDGRAVRKCAKPARRSSGLKVDVVRSVTRRTTDRRPCYAYDGALSTARCGVCGTTAQGRDALGQMREHVAAHYDECRWACARCAFQCDGRAAVVRHAATRHRGRPLRVIRRRRCAVAAREEADLPEEKSREKVIRRRPRGPRSHRESVRIATDTTMWQCAFCSRRSVFRGFIVIHTKLAHFDNEDSVDAIPQRWIRPALHSTAEDVKPCRLDMVRIEDVDRYSTLSDVILSNGENIVQELDDGDADDDAADGRNDSAAEYRCVHCPYRGISPAIVKHHILRTHPSEDVTILDLRSARRRNHEHLLMCRSVECQSISSVEEVFRAHLDAHPSHSTNSIVAVPRHEPKPVEPKPSLQPTTTGRTLSGDADVAVVVSTSSRTPSVGAGAKSRRGTDGPIEYNDDGTIRGLELVCGEDVKMQCTHCCTVMNCDVAEMRGHLSAAHPRLVPLAIQVDCADGGWPASMFFCVVADCSFVTSYYNVYKHHMDVEHPDSETGTITTKHRPSVGGGSAKRRSSPAVHQSLDRSFSPSFRRSRKPACGVLGADRGGGDARGNSPLWDGNPASSDSKKSAAASSSQYNSQDFDFSRRYKCVLCSFTAATLAAMKSHLTATHDAATSHQCIDRRARQLRKRQGVYFCMDADCAFCCKFDDELAQHVEVEHPALRDLSRPQPESAEDCDGDRVYQCANCTYITTDLRNVRIHVVAEHAMAEGGFAEIKTGVGSDGSLIMNVNDVATGRSSDDSACPSSAENGVDLSSVKVDDEGKVFAVL